VTLGALENEPRLDRLITLTTHVDEVAAAVPAHGPVVLVGHSYAGSVITGVADRMPQRNAGLVYLDAFLPEDGDSYWMMTNDEQREWYATGCAPTGYSVDPLPFFSDQARPHPVATLLQALPLTGAWRDVTTKHYVAAQWPEESPMALSTQRAEADPTIVVHHWDVRHNVLADGPDRRPAPVPCPTRIHGSGPLNASPQEDPSIGTVPRAASRFGSWLRTPNQKTYF